MHHPWPHPYIPPPTNWGQGAIWLAADNPPMVGKVVCCHHLHPQTVDQPNLMAVEQDTNDTNQLICALASFIQCSRWSRCVIRTEDEGTSQQVVWSEDHTLEDQTYLQFHTFKFLLSTAFRWYTAGTAPPPPPPAAKWPQSSFQHISLKVKKGKKEKKKQINATAGPHTKLFCCPLFTEVSQQLVHTKWTDLSVFAPRLLDCFNLYGSLQFPLWLAHPYVLSWSWTKFSLCSSIAGCEGSCCQTYLTLGRNKAHFGQIASLSWSYHRETISCSYSNSHLWPIYCGQSKPTQAWGNLLAVKWQFYPKHHCAAQCHNLIYKLNIPSILFQVMWV